MIQDEPRRELTVAERQVLLENEIRRWLPFRYLIVEDTNITGQMR